MRSSKSVRFILSVLLFLIVFVTPRAAFALSPRITQEMILGLKHVSQAVFDHDGNYVAYALSVPRSEKDDPGRDFSEIWVAPVHGDDPRQFTSKPDNSWSPQWSPDGKSITFLSRRAKRDSSTQVYVIPFDGGEARLLFQHEAQVGSYRWSPDGKWIAFSATDRKTEKEKMDHKAGRDWVVKDENEKFSRLWLYSVKSGETKLLTKQNLQVWSYRWSPDSKAVIFQASDAPGADPGLMFKKIYRISVPGGRPRLVCITEGKLGDMAVSPNGTTLAFLGAVSKNDPLPQSLFLVPVEGGEPRMLSQEFEESIVQVDWIDDNTLFFLANRGTGTTLSKVDIQTGARQFVARSDNIVRTFDLNRLYGTFAATASAPDHPTEVFYGSTESDGLARLTHHNPEVETTKLARQEVIDWMAGDGLRIEGVLTYPLNFRKGKRYPLILQIHGGPEGVNLNGWTTSALRPVQLLAAEGYMVLQPNYRGSGGRGVRFSKGDHDDLGGKEFDDILTGIDLLVDRGYVDPDKVGTGGWSYGGYLSAWAVTRYSERFRAAVVGAGLSNWVSFAGTTDIPYEMSIVHWNSWWFDLPDLHWERSPLHYINNAQTPTLVVHGLRDVRVHPEQGMELYQALHLKGVPTQLVLYPREPHGLRERAHKLDYMQRVLAWFDKYVKHARP